jgi:hypothetical protein
MQPLSCTCLGILGADLLSTTPMLCIPPQLMEAARQQVQREERLTSARAALGELSHSVAATRGQAQEARTSLHSRRAAAAERCQVLVRAITALKVCGRVWTGSHGLTGLSLAGALRGASSPAGCKPGCC